MLKKLAIMASMLAVAGTAFAVDMGNVAQKFDLKDGSTVYVFKDGKMAKESRFGDATVFKRGEVLEATDGRKVVPVGNEVARLGVLLRDGHEN